MTISEKKYMDLTVVRTHEVRCWGSGPTDYGEVDLVTVERRLDDHVEIIQPSEPLFDIAVAATA